jgi:hypothetical protein
VRYKIHKKLQTVCEVEKLFVHYLFLVAFKRNGNNENHSEIKMMKNVEIQNQNVACRTRWHKYAPLRFFALTPTNIFKGKNGTEKQGRIYERRVVGIRVSVRIKD